MIAPTSDISTMGQSGFGFRCLGTNGGCGQTFTVSSNQTYLSSFGFDTTRGWQPERSVQPVRLEWLAYTGPALYQSGVTTLLNNSASNLLTYAPNVQLI